MKGILFVLYTDIHQWLIQLNIKSASEPTAKMQVISDVRPYLSFDWYGLILIFEISSFTIFIWSNIFYAQ